MFPVYLSNELELGHFVFFVQTSILAALTLKIFRGPELTFRYMLLCYMSLEDIARRISGISREE